MTIKNITFFTFFTLLCTTTYSQTKQEERNTDIIVQQLILLGNKKTHPTIIHRELDIKIGDTIALKDTTEVFTRNINKIRNTGLFNFVSIQHTSNSIIVLMEERWYIWPIPIFELADRSFNEWWVDRNRDLTRVNIGMDFEHRNFRGRNEKLRIKIQQGFLKKYELSYKIPYLSSFLSNGIKVNASYSTNNKTAYKTIGNKLIFINSETTTRERFHTGIEFNKRPKYYITYTGQLNYKHNKITDTVVTLNPNYFSKNKNTHQYLEAVFSFKLDKRDIQYYPYKGTIVEAKIEQKGLSVFKDLNLTRFTIETAFYKNIKKEIIWENIAKSQLSFPKNIPYFNHSALGYGEDLVRGYELDVIDGNHYLLVKESIKFRIFHRDKLNTLIPIKQFRASPLSIFLHPHLDAGIVDNNNDFFDSPLANKLLVGYGVGLDFVAFYDGVIRLEYSWKKNGIGGFFIHTGTPF